MIKLEANFTKTEYKMAVILTLASNSMKRFVVKLVSLAAPSELTCVISFVAPSQLILPAVRRSYNAIHVPGEPSLNPEFIRAYGIWDIALFITPELHSDAVDGFIAGFISFLL